MKTSTELDAIGLALAKAQCLMPPVPKNSTNPFFKSKYADLADVVRIVAPVIAAEGLSVIQSIGYEDNDETLTTRLLHSSGQWIEDTMILHLGKDDSQGQGSAVTYARRYAYCAITGAVADEDDDGNAAAQSVKNQPDRSQVVNRNVPSKTPIAEAKATLTDCLQLLPSDLREECSRYLRAVFGSPADMSVATVNACSEMAAVWPRDKDALDQLAAAGSIVDFEEIASEASRKRVFAVAKELGLDAHQVVTEVLGADKSVALLTKSESKRVNDRLAELEKQPAQESF